MPTFEFDPGNLLAVLLRSRRCPRCGSRMTVEGETREADSDWIRDGDGIEYDPDRRLRRYRFRCAGRGTGIDPSRQPLRWRA